MENSTDFIDITDVDPTSGNITFNTGLVPGQTYVVVMWPVLADSSYGPPVAVKDTLGNEQYIFVIDYVTIFSIFDITVPIAPYIGEVQKLDDNIVLVFESPEGVSDEFLIATILNDEGFPIMNTTTVNNTGIWFYKILG